MTEKKQNKWTKSSWRSFPARQQPLWPDARTCKDTLKKLSHLPALVFAAAVFILCAHLPLARVAAAAGVGEEELARHCRFIDS